MEAVDIRRFFKSEPPPTMSDCIIQHGKGKNGPVRPFSKERAYCYTCDKELTTVRAHKRKRNGIEGNVIAHFRHLSDSSCKGESNAHLAAKDMIVKGRPDFHIACLCCKTAILVRVFEPGSVATAEVAWMTKRLDIGVTTGGVVTGAVEVYATHRIDEEKALLLTTSGIAWCEVDADTVLASKGSIECIRAAVNQCDACNEEARRVLGVKNKKRLHDLLHGMTTRAQKTIEANQTELFVTDAIKEYKLLPSDEKYLIGEAVWRLKLDVCEDMIRIQGLSPDAIFKLTGITASEKAYTAAKREWTRMLDLIRVQARDDSEIATIRLNAKVVKAIDTYAELAGYNVPEFTEKDADDLKTTALALLDTPVANVVTMGKYKGSTINQIMEIDPGYVVWLAGWTGERDGKRPAELSVQIHQAPWRGMARKLLEGTCIACFKSTGNAWMHWCSSCYHTTV